MSYIYWEIPDPKGFTFISRRVLQFDAVLSESHDFDSEVTEHVVEEGVNVSDHVRPNLKKVSLEVLFSDSPIFGRLSQVITPWGATSVQEALPINVLPNVATPLSIPTVSFGGYKSTPLEIPEVPLKVPLNPAGALVTAVESLVALVTSKGPVVATAGLINNTVVGAGPTPAYIQTNTETGGYLSGVIDELLKIHSNSYKIKLFTERRFYEDMILNRISIKRDGPAGNLKVSLGFVELRTVKAEFGEVTLPAIKKGEKKSAAPLATPTVKKEDSTSEFSIINALRSFGISIPGAN